MKFKKVFTVIISIIFICLITVPVSAGSAEYETDTALIQKAYNLYALMYEMYEDPEYVDFGAGQITDEYTDKAAKLYGDNWTRFKNGIRTASEFKEHLRNFFSDEIADGIVKDTKYFKIIDGQVVQMVDQKINWRFYANPEETAPVVEDETADTVTYSATFNVDNHTAPGPLEKRTFIIKHGENGARIIGGTFIEEAFYIGTEDGTPISDASFRHAFSRAEAMAEWFTLFMPENSGKEDVPRLVFGGKTIYLKSGTITESDGNDGALPFALVENYKNTAELKEDLKTVFSDGIVERLLNKRYTMSDGCSYPHFVEYNGRLYYKNWAYASNYNTRPEINLKAEQTTKTKLIYSASFKDIHESDKSYDYKFELVDGRWVFTKFELPKYLYHKDVIKEDFASPMTADVPVIAVCALAVSAIAAAVIFKKKRGI